MWLHRRWESKVIWGVLLVASAYIIVSAVGSPIDLTVEPGLLQVSLFAAMYVAMVKLLIPATWMNVAAGLVFGLAGVLVASIAAVAAASLANLGRQAQFEDGTTGLEQHWPRTHSRLATEPRVFWILRLFPVFPFGLVSQEALRVGINRRRYLLVSTVGASMGSAPFVLLGAAIQRLIYEGALLPLLVAATILGSFLFIGVWYQRRDLVTLEPTPSGRRQGPQTSESEFDLSVVIPAYNEADRISDNLQGTVDFLNARGDRFEVIVVDDGSNDETVSVVRKYAERHPEVRVLVSPKNMGKGFAVRTGVVNSRGRRVMFADADGSTPISALEGLEAALDVGASVAIGSRALNSVDVERSTKAHRKIMGRVFNRIVSTLLLPGLKDTQCGFKLFTRQAADEVFALQTCDGFSFDVELLFIARRLGFVIEEVAVNWSDVAGSKVNIVRDSICMFSDTLRVLSRDITGNYQPSTAPEPASAPIQEQNT